MHVSEEIINRFLSGYASEAEKAAVRAYFLAHPQELEKYLTEESWSAFQATERLAAADSEKMLQAIGDLTYRRRRGGAVLFFRVAAAVVILLAAGAGIFWLNRQPAQDVAMAAEIPASEEERVNNTPNVMQAILPDGSLADIYPGSSIRYRQPFGEQDREVHLQGQARFSVKSNAGKPFTVFAGNLGTTALGTVFRIDARHGKVLVQLESGKVMVSPSSQNAGQTMAPVYLKPGEKLYYDEEHHTVSVEPVPAKPVKPAPVAATPAEKEIPAVVMLQFENEPLSALFNTIETEYGMQVKYKPGTLDNMYFTGVFNSEKESLPDFLNTIALLNNVTIRISKNIIYITP
ncbi:FecR domain-containing protein [Chitinophaga sp.]|uniref:FecR domain-containing protein n=1 Tax=Chitinophaga sp. TaxID=1869181 RepID=UPI0031D8A050